MKRSIKKGFGFGVTSGVITTLGLMVGLNSSTHSKQAILAGILVIAIADALSDAFGIHVSEESANKSKKEIWESTFATLSSKFLTAIIFVIPVIFFELKFAVMMNIAIGLFLISSFSYYISEKKHRASAILEHILISLLVIILTDFIGSKIPLLFG